MKTTLATSPAALPALKNQSTAQTAFLILGGLGCSHFLNDMVQVLLSAMYPLLKNNFHLNFAQIGLLTFSFQMTASLLQPLVGIYTDRHPKPYYSVLGMGLTLCGLLLLSAAPNFIWLLIAAALFGIGSSIFHPEASRMAYAASGGRHGLAQSIFQLGGNAGTALAPLLAAWVITPGGQHSIAWFALVILLAMLILRGIGRWYQSHLLSRAKTGSVQRAVAHPLPRGKIIMALSILLILVFSKYFYLTSLISYFPFYLINKFHLSVQAAQVYLFIFLFAFAIGTLLGGPLSDRFGRIPIIWVSILGVAPFTLILPYASLFWTGVLTLIIGMILASAFAPLLVYAQELMPDKIGTISGLFFGFTFGMAGIGAALLGKLADLTDIDFVYHVCAFLPLLGLLTAFLPKNLSNPLTASP